MFSKVEINGIDCHPVYKFLRSNSNLYDAKKKSAKEVPWNFVKFLVDEDGKVLEYYSTDTFANSFRDRIEDLLKIKRLNSQFSLPKNMLD